MSDTRLLFLSDIHIGSNAKTNWYQRDLHEPMLLPILEYAIANANNIAEFVILGDLIDQWTYLPEVTPPSFDEIATVNPAIFGPGGALAILAATMPERVTYMPGNHDMALTAEALSAKIGQPIRSVKGPIYTPAAGKGQVACTHGHIYSIFNAPDLVGDPKHSLPLGHFITRLAALDASQKLVPGQTVADLPQSGDPTGAGLLDAAFKGIFETFMTGDASLGRLVMDTLLDAVNKPANMPFVMLDGTQITGADVIRAYDNLFERYGSGAEYPASLYGRHPALMALIDTDARNTIAHFAEILSSRYAAIVMGHTHTSEDEADKPLFGKNYIYVNSGFNCPSKPDIAANNATGRVTFAEVIIDNDNHQYVGRVRRVERSGEGYVVAPESVGRINIARMR
jgi:UDP-2,3-diacylglucosamine pyrophosphatase LpxH